jgi:pyruvate kinase
MTTAPIFDGAQLLDALRTLRRDIQADASHHLARWPAAAERAAFGPSMENLAHYLALRHRDLRPLQAALGPWGLSSLGRSESRVVQNLDAVIRVLEVLGGERSGDDDHRPVAGVGYRRLRANTEELFGPPRDGRETRIMVTLSPKYGLDEDIVARLVGLGMDCARINCAQDSPQVWQGMIDTVRAVAQASGRPCLVHMDLGGPKIRTETVITPEDGRKVQAGDRILLTYEEPTPCPDVEFQASCGAPEALRAIEVGAEVSIRDGRIAGEIVEARPDGLIMAVHQIGPKGEPLVRHKGINFPGTALSIPPLTGADLAALDFVADRADVVGYSFVQQAEDMALLQDELRARRGDRPPMPIVAKVETQLAFANLPEIVVQAASRNPFGVMIARGDLAVEIGFERLAEVQEEILWLCEAAHVPVIWATQVLESLVKHGMRSRGEYTDAAMGARAECVMLNKGNHIDRGVAALDDVLRRMERHQSKKSPQLGELRAWRGRAAS